MTSTQNMSLSHSNVGGVKEKKCLLYFNTSLGGQRSIPPVTPQTIFSSLDYIMILRFKQFHLEYQITCFKRQNFSNLSKLR